MGPMLSRSNVMTLSPASRLSNYSVSSARPTNDKRTNVSASRLSYAPSRWEELLALLRSASQAIASIRMRRVWTQVGYLCRVATKCVYISTCRGSQESSYIYRSQGSTFQYTEKEGYPASARVCNYNKSGRLGVKLS